mmetsp:Transcript_44569/g.127154  ORF Transcript_44569/g.127154 Transcript_44569/m.127154 type:complete len:201 (-) Transcript_44569:62-664(-)
MPAVTSAWSRSCAESSALSFAHRRQPPSRWFHQMLLTNAVYTTNTAEMPVPINGGSRGSPIPLMKGCRTPTTVRTRVHNEAHLTASTLVANGSTRSTKRTMWPTQGQRCSHDSWSSSPPASLLRSLARHASMKESRRCLTRRICASASKRCPASLSDQRSSSSTRTSARGSSGLRRADSRRQSQTCRSAAAAAESNTLSS